MFCNPGRIKKSQQRLLDPGELNRDSPPLQFGAQIYQLMHGRDVKDVDRTGIDHDPLDWFGSLVNLFQQATTKIIDIEKKEVSIK